MEITRKARSLARRVGVKKKIHLASRKSSFPFISGDTFRTFADFIVESEVQQKHLIAVSMAVNNTKKIIFVSADYATTFLNDFPIELAKDLTILIHNGDLVPTDAIYQHSHKFRQIFSVNWLGDPAVATPIPVGLENAWHGVNGRVKLFSDVVPGKRNVYHGEARSRKILVAFNINTNVQERTKAARIFAESNLKEATLESLSIREYHKCLRKTQFVVSPPGNGPDCHRTWESMYCGAIPIVLESQWSFTREDFPVFVTPSWDYAVEILEGSSDDLYREYAEKSTGSHFADVYFEKIRNSQKQ